MEDPSVANQQEYKKECKHVIKTRKKQNNSK